MLPTSDALQRAYMRRVILNCALYICSRLGKVRMHDEVVNSMTNNVRKVAGMIGLWAREGSPGYRLVPQDKWRMWADIGKLSLALCFGAAVQGGYGCMACASDVWTCA